MPTDRFAEYDAGTGEIVTCYTSDVHNSGSMPSNILQMTEEEFSGHVSGSSPLAVNVNADPMVFIPKPSESPSLIEAQASAHFKVISWMNELTVQLRSGYPKDEVSTWSLKGPQARAVLAGDPPGLLITTEATVTGETPLQVATRIVALADSFETIMGTIAGVRRGIQLSIDTALDAAAAEAAATNGLASAAATFTNLGLTVPQ